MGLLSNKRWLKIVSSSGDVLLMKCDLKKINVIGKEKKLTKKPPRHLFWGNFWKLNVTITLQGLWLTCKHTVEETGFFFFTGYLTPPANQKIFIAFSKSNQSLFSLITPSELATYPFSLPCAQCQKTQKSKNNEDILKPDVDSLSACFFLILKRLEELWFYFTLLIPWL